MLTNGNDYSNAGYRGHSLTCFPGHFYAKPVPFALPTLTVTPVAEPILLHDYPSAAMPRPVPFPLPTITYGVPKLDR